MKLSQSQLLSIKNKQKSTQYGALIDEAKVKQYLLDNANFLSDNPEVLSHIELDYKRQDTFSLVERQIKVLREKNSQLQGQQIEMLQIAQTNEELLYLCNQLMLDLITCDDLAALTSCVVEQLKKLFELDGAAIILIGQYDPPPSVPIFTQAKQIKELLLCQFPDSQPLCGRLNQSAKLDLFGELSLDFQSFALIPLGDGCQIGLLALASKDVSRFSPDMGTLFIELIAKHLSALIRPYQLRSYQKKLKQRDGE